MIMEDKPLYVSLEAMVPTRDDDRGKLLVRKIEQSYLADTVYDVIQKMLDPEADSLNDAYNAAEREVANTVTKWFKDMNEDPNNFSVSVMALPSDGEPVPMSLDDKISNPKYDSIIKIKEEINPETNAKENYKLIDLFVKRRVCGGNLGIYGLIENLEMFYER